MNSIRFVLRGQGAQEDRGLGPLYIQTTDFAPSQKGRAAPGKGPGVRQGRCLRVIWERYARTDSCDKSRHMSANVDGNDFFLAGLVVLWGESTRQMSCLGAGRAESHGVANSHMESSEAGRECSWWQGGLLCEHGRQRVVAAWVGRVRAVSGRFGQVRAGQKTIFPGDGGQQGAAANTDIGGREFPAYSGVAVCKGTRVTCFLVKISLPRRGRERE